ncbi:MAG: ParB N-terminal domain-containing protein [Alphaproteobacteria bacterium]|jgi:hypothetical protein|nr:ParB N-terminal domain-containing protein [Alphaproteobacteria bacterium]MBT4018261.1 ParB N-terminal domain-containing protein [Alphaproteobacteria bacterium]MBT4542357.1 ParB N-terminal domain-containing protein [Alphaproteobacteria bacterium]MBT5161273.1 ParB N-terminal domain-containing protein [Alphaproteobacteria bacterium]MBT5917795.1 ParB N-terminal domain-containing protein [Alphaproteobacteria bacterium]
MREHVKMAFKRKSIFLKLEDILPVKQLPKSVQKTRKYQQITASILAIGIIEPPVISRPASGKGKFLLLDGHLRIQILRDLEVNEVTCLVATDDEAFTYNKRVNRLATIQEHKMILKAIKDGVPEKRIAKALDINISSIRQKRRLLEGICPEAAELLKDKHCPMNSFESLRKMKPLRQIEVVELMIAMDNYSVNYSKAILAATPQDQLVDTGKPKAVAGISAEKIALMETEMAGLQREVKQIEDSYGTDHLNLVLARGYLDSLIRNEEITRYLEQNHSEILGEFRRISDVMSMGPQEPR